MCLFSDSAISNTKTSRRLVPPKTTVTKTDSKFETCERHISQLLVRGEHIAFIVILEAKKGTEI